MNTILVIIVSVAALVFGLPIVCLLWVTIFQPRKCYAPAVKEFWEMKMSEEWIVQNGSLFDYLALGVWARAMRGLYLKWFRLSVIVTLFFIWGYFVYLIAILIGALWRKI